MTRGDLSDAVFHLWTSELDDDKIVEAINLDEIREGNLQSKQIIVDLRVPKAGHQGNEIWGSKASDTVLGAYKSMLGGIRTELGEPSSEFEEASS